MLVSKETGVTAVAAMLIVFVILVWPDMLSCAVGCWR